MSWHGGNREIELFFVSFDDQVLPGWQTLFKGTREKRRWTLSPAVTHKHTKSRHNPIKSFHSCHFEMVLSLLLFFRLSVSHLFLWLTIFSLFLRAPALSASRLDSVQHMPPLPSHTETNYGRRRKEEEKWERVSLGKRRREKGRERERAEGGERGPWGELFILRWHLKAVYLSESPR